MSLFDTMIVEEEKRLKEKKFRRANPFENAVFDEGEFITIKSQVTIEPIVEEEPDASTDSRPSIPD